MAACGGTPVRAGVCGVNVTVAVCPRAVAVTVAVCVPVTGTGGRETTFGPLSPERDPGPLSDQVTSFANSAGLAVISTDDGAGWFPEGEMLSVGFDSPVLQA